MEDFVTKTLFWLISSAMMIAVSITGLFVRMYIAKNEREKEQMADEIRKNKNMVESQLSGIVKDFREGVDSLKSAVHEIKELIAVIRTQHSAEIADCQRRLTHKRTWLEDHDHKIDKIHDRLTIVESDCRHYHKK